MTRSTDKYTLSNATSLKQFSQHATRAGRLNAIAHCSRHSHHPHKHCVNSLTRTTNSHLTLSVWMKAVVTLTFLKGILLEVVTATLGTRWHDSGYYGGWGG